MNRMTDEIFEQVMQEKGREAVTLPKNLNRDTLRLIEAHGVNDAHVLPYLIAALIFINMLISILTGTVLYMMAPLTMVDWLIMGSIYASFNALFYGLTYAYRDQVNEFLSELGGV